MRFIKNRKGKQDVEENKKLCSLNSDYTKRISVLFYSFGEKRRSELEEADFLRKEK